MRTTISVLFRVFILILISLFFCFYIGSLTVLESIFVFSQVIEIYCIKNNSSYISNYSFSYCSCLTIINYDILDHYTRRNRVFIIVATIRDEFNNRRTRMNTNNNNYNNEMEKKAEKCFIRASIGSGCDTKFQMYSTQ